MQSINSDFYFIIKEGNEKKEYIILISIIKLKLIILTKFCRYL